MLLNPCSRNKRRKNCEVSRWRSQSALVRPLAVRDIHKFKDRASWSRDTFQPMRRRACVYQQTNQNIAPVIQNFQNSGRSRTELKMSLQDSSRFYIEHFKENISWKRTGALFIARNHWGVRTDSGPIAKAVASLAWPAIFLIEANWSRVKIALEGV